MRSVLLLLALTVLQAMLSTVTHAASFDCAKTTTRLEKIICKDDELSTLDSRMNDAYKRALVAWDGQIKKYMQNNQREFLAQMREIESGQSETSPVCESLQDIACLRREMQRRVDTLESAAYSMSGVYQRDAKAKLLVYAGKASDFQLRVFNPNAGQKILATPVADAGIPTKGATRWSGPYTMVSKLVDNEAKPQCEISVTYTALQATVRQTGKCGDQNFAGVYQRNLKETLMNYEFELY